jgi:ribosomal protein L7/L12
MIMPRDCGCEWVKPYDHGMFGLTIEFVVLVLAALLTVAALVVVLAAVRAGARPSTSLGWRSPGLPPPISADLQNRVRALLAEGRKAQAIKVLREETGIGPREGKNVVDAIAAGQPIPGTTPSPIDLASRARELKASGRSQQAVMLVRDETGMGQAEAEAFINAL